MAILVSDPFDLNLTRRFLVENKLPVLVAGDDWSMRFQVRNAAGIGRSLAGALVIMSITDEDGVVLFTRRSDTNITATSTKQVAIDANQTTEPGDDTGKGWYQVNCSDEDATALIAAVGLRFYDLRIKFGDGTIITNFQGRVEVVRPRTQPVS